MARKVPPSHPMSFSRSAGSSGWLTSIMFIEMYAGYAKIAQNPERVFLMCRATEIELMAGPSRTIARQRLI